MIVFVLYCLMLLSLTFLVIQPLGWKYYYCYYQYSHAINYSYVLESSMRLKPSLHVVSVHRTMYIMQRYLLDIYPISCFGV